jgi:hypothetical protein
MAKKNTRNDDGTFAPGNPGGPGRPKRSTETAYMSTVMEKCDLETWGAIVDKAVADAKEGDRYAREWLTRYLLGEPSPRLFAPPPSRVIAREETGDDAVDAEIARLRREKFINEMM